MTAHTPEERARLALWSLAKNLADAAQASAAHHPRCVRMDEHVRVDCAQTGDLLMRRATHRMIASRPPRVVRRTHDPVSCWAHGGRPVTSLDQFGADVCSCCGQKVGR